jgi:hypothetical protein
LVGAGVVFVLVGAGVVFVLVGAGVVFVLVGAGALFVLAGAVFVDVVAGLGGAVVGGGIAGTSPGGGSAGVPAAGGSPATVAGGGTSIVGAAFSSEAPPWARSTKKVVMVPPISTNAPIPTSASDIPDLAGLRACCGRAWTGGTGTSAGTGPPTGDSGANWAGAAGGA